MLCVFFTGIALPASGKHAAAAVVTAHPSSAQPVSGGRGQLQEKLHNKLQQLQQLQYELTRQVCLEILCSTKYARD